MVLAPFSSCAANIASNGTIYVSTDGNDNNNGLSEVNAKRTIQNATNSAKDDTLK